MIMPPPLPENFSSCLTTQPLHTYDKTGGRPSKFLYEREEDTSDSSMTPNIGDLKYNLYDFSSPSTSAGSTIDLKENTPKKPYWAPKKSGNKKKNSLKM